MTFRPEIQPVMPTPEGAQAERELATRSIERLDARLAEIDPKSVKLLSKEGDVVGELMRTYVFEEVSAYEEARRAQITRIVTPSRVENIQGVRLQFTPDADGYFGKSELLSKNFLQPGFFEEYKNLLKDIEGVKDRHLPEDREVKLLENLDRRRRALHNEAAAAIQENLGRNRKYFDHVSIDQAAGRKLFEILYRIWDAPASGRSLTYSEGRLDFVDLDKLKERIHSETGARIGIDDFTYGWHENAPENQYEVSFLDPIRPDIEARVKEIIAIEIQESLKTSANPSVNRRPEPMPKEEWSLRQKEEEERRRTMDATEALAAKFHALYVPAVPPDASSPMYDDEFRVYEKARLLNEACARHTDTLMRMHGRVEDHAGEMLEIERDVRELRGRYDDAVTDYLRARVHHNPFGQSEEPNPSPNPVPPAVASDIPIPIAQQKTPPRKKRSWWKAGLVALGLLPVASKVVELGEDAFDAARKATEEYLHEPTLDPSKKSVLPARVSYVPAKEPQKQLVEELPAKQKKNQSPKTKLTRPGRGAASK